MPFTNARYFAALSETGRQNEGKKENYLGSRCQSDGGKQLHASMWSVTNISTKKAV